MNRNSCSKVSLLVIVILLISLLALGIAIGGVSVFSPRGTVVETVNPTIEKALYATATAKVLSTALAR